ncbi:MAG: cysteine synthase family protein [Candidatus Zixiibacteriota bacterium]
MQYRKNIFDLIGNTPLLEINNGLKSGVPKLLAKLEFFNPGGSVKDRMAEHILKKALKEGRIKPGDTIIDNTSGNYGVSLAMIATNLGLKAILTTPDKTSKEKVDLIKSYGAEVIVTPADVDHHHPDSCYMTGKRLAQENGWFHTDQYDNPDNIEAHYLSTGPELWENTEGQITHLVAGIGTGGTFSGVMKYLKEQNPAIMGVAVDPEGSIFGEFIKNNKVGDAKAYKIEGIGSDCITKALIPEMVDRLITVSDQIAFETARAIAREEGISVGGSAGAAIWAARQIIPELEDKAVVVVIVADSGTRYLTKCFNDIWMKEQGFKIKV